MLTLGANSSCDICLELFSADHRAPYSIQCGHVFCLDCIRRVSPPECPLCRMPYHPGTWMKLHVDILCQTETEKEARRLQEAIGEVTTMGSSEANLRQLINECRVFLQAQPRSMYSDLRVAYRMLSYLYEVKTNLRSQSAAVETLKDEISQLTAEKEELEKLQHLKEEITQLEADKHELQSRLEESEVARGKDKQFATDLESKLNECVTRSESSYQFLSRYSNIVQEYANLNEELKYLRSKVLDYTKSAVGSPDPEILPQSLSPASEVEEYVPSPNQSPGSNTSSVPEIIDRSSPVFVGPFTTALEAVYSRRKLNRCDADDHSVSCQCDSPPSSPSKRMNVPKPVFIIEHVSASRRQTISTAPVERQSGLSRTAPKNQESAQGPDRIRVRSFSDVPPMPSRPPSRHQDRDDDESRPPSEPVSRSSSPDHTLERECSARIDSSPSENVRRLYHILQKPHPPPSTSPELSSSLGSMHKLRYSNSRSPSRSRSGSTASLQAPPGTVQLPPPSNYSHPQPPSNVISRASDAAMAIEKSRGEKLREREREKERREYRKSDKDDERTDGDRARAESDRSPKKQRSGALSASYSLHTPPTSAYHSAGLPASPHREAHPSVSPANASQKNSIGSGTGTLGRNSSIKISSANYSRLGSDSPRDGNPSFQSQTHRHGSGNNNNKTTAPQSNTPPISV